MASRASTSVSVQETISDKSLFVATQSQSGLSVYFPNRLGNGFKPHTEVVSRKRFANRFSAFTQNRFGRKRFGKRFRLLSEWEWLEVVCALLVCFFHSGSSLLEVLDQPLTTPISIGSGSLFMRLPS